MNHMMTEKYIGGAVQHGVLGQYMEGKECLLLGTCDRLLLFLVDGQQLIKIKEKRVFGYIVGIEHIRGGGKGKDTDGAIVHFEHANASSIYFDREKNEFVSTILRHYEKQEYGFVHTAERMLPMLRIDNEHKMAFMFLSKTHFVLFSTEEAGKSKVIEVDKVRPRHCVIKDAAFLQGFSSSTICFLFENTKGDKCQASVYVVEEEEKELRLFFAVEMIPYGCYSVVPMNNRVFMVLGVNGGIFYTQWEMVGVCFNSFWNIESMGIEEVKLDSSPFVIDNGKCVSYGQSVFIFGEECIVRLTTLGTEGRVHKVVAEKIVIPGVCVGEPVLCRAEKDKVLYICTGGIHLMSAEKEELVMEESIQTESIVQSKEFSEVFLTVLEEAERDRMHARKSTITKNVISNNTITEDVIEKDAITENAIAKEIKHTEISVEEDKIYNEMFGGMQEIDHSVKKTGISSTLFASKLSLLIFYPLLGQISCIEYITYTEKKKEYIAACGSFVAPLLVKMKEGIEPIFIKTVRVRGYTDMFPVDPVQKMYLLVKEAESELMQWEVANIKPVECGIEKEEYTVKWLELKNKYAQITYTSIIYLNRNLEREKKIVFTEKVFLAAAQEDKILVLNESGNVLIYTGTRKKKLPLQNIRTFFLFENKLVCVNESNHLLIYSLAENKVIFYSPCLSFLSHILENEIDSLEENSKARTSKAKISAADQTINIQEILVLDRGYAVYYVLRLIHNEIVVYRENEARFYRERVPDNSFYYEKTATNERKRRKMQACIDFIMVPGRISTRFLFFTPNGIYVHLSLAPIESIVEIPYGNRRSFMVLAKGNLAEGILPSYSYDKSVAYKTMQTEFFCEKVVFYKEKRVILASAFKEVDYTKEMVPFTVLSTTEVDAPPTKMPEIAEVEILPKTRAYSLKVYSLEEMKRIRCGEMLLSVDSYAMENNEYISHHKIMDLPDKQSVNERSTFIVVCTTYITDEDLMSTGRLLVFEIASVVPERNRKETKHKLKLLAVEKTKSAATACEEICGNIAVCLGTKLMVYAFERNEGLKAVAFHDMQVFLTSCSVIRNILVCADAYKGVFFFFFQSEPPQLHLLAQSMGTVDLLLGVSMSLLKESCALISYDASRNIYIHSYSPQNILSQKGTRLITRAECRLPDVIAGSFRIISDREYAVVLYTKNGYLYRHSMIEQNRHSVLLDLQYLIISQLRLTLGTNAAAHWIAEKPAEMKEITLKEIAQSGIAEEYFEMSTLSQKKVNSSAGKALSDTVKEELAVYRK